MSHKRVFAPSVNIQPRRRMASVVAQHTSTEYLQDAQVSFEKLPKPVPEELLRITLWRSESGQIPAFWLSIVLATESLDPAFMRQSVGYTVTPTSESLLPFPELYHISGVISTHIPHQGYVCFSTEEKGWIYRISAEDLHQLNKNQLYANLSMNTSLEKEIQVSAQRMKERILQINEQPAMPPIVEDILKLRVDPEASISDLVKVIEHDPGLSAQVMSWATSPYYGYVGRLEGVEDAIFRVLGFDLVLNLVLGVTMSQSFHAPIEGILGAKACWKHALYSGLLAGALRKELVRMHHPVSLSMGLSYLCGLLHNFGYLLMGQWFQPHWQYLEDTLITNPHCAWISLEQHALGLDHAALGGWLMEKWNMPIEVICSVKHHHDLHYDGPEIVYVWLIQVVDYLLGTLNMGENAQIQAMPERAFHGLGLTRARAMALLNELAPEQGELDTLVNRLIVKK